MTHTDFVTPGQRRLTVASLVLLLVAVALGGASRQHELRLAIVELAALPVLWLSLPALAGTDQWKAHRFALLVLSLLALLPLLQITPLPPTLWTALPNRDDLRLALELAGLPLGWVPLSLTPDKTWRSFLALLPPLAMFVATLSVSDRDRLWLVRAVLFAAVAAILLGAAQLLSGGDQLYPWRTTDVGAVTGFFANRNHLATLCLVAIPFCAVLGARALRGGTRESAITLWLCFSMMGLLVVMLGVIRSRTGIALAVPVVVASLLVARLASGAGRPRLFILGLGATAAVAAAAVGVFALGPIIERFDRLGSTEGRFENWPIVADAADAYLPVGSGLGSFDAVFRSVEPITTLDSTFFNQAHNDYLETWLETGWFGIALLVVFLVWFARRSWAAWRAGAGDDDGDLARAASIAVAIVLAHSAVDYPLRTETIAVVFAICCALLELAQRAGTVDRAGSPERGRRRRRRSS